MSFEIDFSGKYSFNVQVNHDELGDLGEATLRFGADHWPHLRFDDWQVYARLGDEKKYARLRATSRDGETFSLFDCSVVGFYVSIEYVVAGDVSDEFKAISIRFDDINEWFMPFRGIEEKLNREAENSDRLKQINVAVEVDTQSFNLTTETVLRINHKGEDHIVHEHVIFNFERVDGRFFVKDIKERSHELFTLLSILTAIPLYFLNVLVTCENDDSYYAFFSSFKKPERNPSSRSWVDYFARKPLIDGRWQLVFENYYRSAYRRVSWVRLAGMQRYDGFWEYRALGYVSLLDKYVGQRSAGQKRKPSKGQELKDTKVHTALKRVLPALSDAQEGAVFSVIAEIFMKNGELSFGERYRYVLGTMNENIRAIINFTNDDFTKIKEIRDAVAHGEAPDLIEADYGRVGIIVSKIALLLTYWAFIDFGLNDEDFLSCFQTNSQLHARAGIDRIRLARVTKSAGFYQVSEEQLDKISKIKNIKMHPCFVQHSDGSIEYSEDHVTALQAWYLKRQSGEIPIAQLFGQSKDKIKCWDQAYIEAGPKRLELIQAYFIESV